MCDKRVKVRGFLKVCVTKVKVSVSPEGALFVFVSQSEEGLDVAVPSVSSAVQDVGQEGDHAQLLLGTFV